MFDFTEEPTKLYDLFNKEVRTQRIRESIMALLENTTSDITYNKEKHQCEWMEMDKEPSECKWMNETLFQLMDANGDGKISPEGLLPTKPLTMQCSVECY